MRVEFAEWFAHRCDLDAPVAVAFSGGGDSTALLHLTCSAHRSVVYAVIVDHGLRPESAAEAEVAAARAMDIGAQSVILTWQPPLDIAQGVQARARRARYALLSNWRRQAKTGPLLLGHTLDDVAETFLLRTARGSGVDGLAIMDADRWEEPAPAAEAEQRPRLRLLRPLLDVSRATLRQYCVQNGLAWHDDPSNNDARFDRVKARDALARLKSFGITAPGLAKTARQMRRARMALERTATDSFRRFGVVAPCAMWVRLSLDLWTDTPEEITLRIFARSLEWMGGQPYPPRFDSLKAIHHIAPTPAIHLRRTLHGCIIERWRDAVFIFREPVKAPRETIVRSDCPFVWDNRYRLRAQPGDVVRPAGSSLIVKDAPRDAARGSPSIWRNEICVAHGEAPAGHCASLAPLRATFEDSLARWDDAIQSVSPSSTGTPFLGECAPKNRD